jgi:hypothetical protein
MRTDMTKLTVNFRSFTRAPEDDSILVEACGIQHETDPINKIMSRRDGVK